MLAPLGALYGLSVKARRMTATPYRSTAQVICVGNLTAGGTGKTQIAIALGRLLTARGKKVVFLSRGYQGRLKGPVVVETGAHSASDVGDEPLLLAAHAPTIVSRDRAAGAKLAETLRADVIVMDDGHQNFQLEKDLSLVVIDASVGFGNGRVIPAGPLRERPGEGLARANAVVAMGDGTPALFGFAGPVLRARVIPDAAGGLHRHTVFAFCGIANPERFFSLLGSIGAQIAGQRTFPDHHPYTDDEIAALTTAAKALGAELVTTEKDFVRLGASQRDGVIPLPVRAVFDDGAAAAALLDRLTTGAQSAGA